MLYHVTSSTKCWKPLLKAVWEWEWVEWRLGCSLIWSPQSTLGTETSTRGSRRVPGLYGSLPLLNAKKPKNKQTGGPREADIYRPNHQHQLFFSSSAFLSLCLTCVSTESLARFNKCLCQLSPAWHHIERRVHGVCFTLSYK